MRLLKCPRATCLPDKTLAYLNGLPNAGMVIESDVGCELEVGHPDQHCCLGQVTDTGDFFLYWHHAGLDIRTAPRCANVGIIEDEELTCVLPAGHWGADSFELEDH